MEALDLCPKGSGNAVNVVWVSIYCGILKNRNLIRFDFWKDLSGLRVGSKQT